MSSGLDVIVDAGSNLDKGFGGAYHMSSVTLFNGHVLSILQSLLDESVHCCITSPPYWALRDYGLEPGDLGASVALY